MNKAKNIYTEEFKREAIALWKSSEKSLAQVARELGVSDNTMHGWKRQLEQHGADAFPGSGHQTPLEEENRRLRRELERVQQERDILKKAVAIFSQHQYSGTSSSLSSKRTIQSSGGCPDHAGLRQCFFHLETAWGNSTRARRWQAQKADPRELSAACSAL